MKKLTDKQGQVYDFIVTFISDKGYSPTYRDISERFGMLPRAAYDAVRFIEKKGYIKTTPRVARSIVIIKDAGVGGVA